MKKNNLKKVLPVILAGGLGTRLRPVIGDFPKVLSPIRNKPFIVYLLKQLANVGFNEVFLCVGYKGDLVADTIGTDFENLNVNYSFEKKPLGTGGALLNLLPSLNQQTQTLMVLNGDSYIDINFGEYVNWHFKNNIKASIVTTMVDNVGRYGRVLFNDQNAVVGFEEKNDKCKVPGWINAGVYLFPKTLLNQMSHYNSFSLEHKFLPVLIKNKLYGYKCDNKFIDIGTPNSYEKTDSFFETILADIF